MILHDFALSSASYRVRIALALKGLDYDRRNYKLRAGEQRDPAYLAVNPAGLVPTLEVDGLVLTQSLAIIDYLDNRWPVPQLVPADPAIRAKVLAIALTIACDIHPLNNLRTLFRLEAEGLDDARRNDWYATWVTAGFTAVEAMIDDGAGGYALGQTPSLADICIVPQMFNARRFDVDLTPFPKLVAVDEYARAHPAFAAAAPEMA